MGNIINTSKADDDNVESFTEIYKDPDAGELDITKYISILQFSIKVIFKGATLVDFLGSLRKK